MRRMKVFLFGVDGLADLRNLSNTAWAFAKVQIKRSAPHKMTISGHFCAKNLLCMMRSVEVPKGTSQKFRLYSYVRYMDSILNSPSGRATASLEALMLCRKHLKAPGKPVKPRRGDNRHRGRPEMMAAISRCVQRMATEMSGQGVANVVGMPGAGERSWGWFGRLVKEGEPEGMLLV